MNLTDKERNLLEALYTKELSDAYAAAGRPMADANLLSVAKSLVDPVGATSGEVRGMFAIAKASTDLPTQRNLMAALRTLREERGRERKRVDAICDWPDGMSYREYVLLTGDRRISELANRPRVGFAL